MTLFNYNKNLPTDTAYQETFNTNVSEVIGRILAVALNQVEIQQLIDDTANAAATLITSAESPYEIDEGDKFIEVDTSGGVVTVRLQASSVVNPGYTVKVVRVAGGNNVTVDCTTNSCTINGAAANTTISTSYAPKTYKLLETVTDDYLED
jgi:hypothetical protein